jgi:hypothetical protein
METSDDSVLVALPNVELNHRLARTDYANDPKKVDLASISGQEMDDRPHGAVAP